MRKFKLELDALNVESFAPAEGEEGAGTVHAHGRPPPADPPTNPCVATETCGIDTCQASCAGSCFGSCYGTCAGATCDATCFATCAYTCDFGCQPTDSPLARCHALTGTGPLEG